jgi:hypothetical protein
MATDMGLGGCAIGTTNIDLFAKMTGSNSTLKVQSANLLWSRREAGRFQLTF